MLSLIVGNEPSLLTKAYAKLSKEAQAQGYQQIHKLEINSQEDFAEIDLVMQPDLFEARKLLIVQLGSFKLNATINAKLLEHVSCSSGKLAWLLQINKMPSKIPEWLSYIRNHGKYISLKSPATYQWLEWLKSRLTEQQLSLNHDAILWLQQAFAGNIAATEQALNYLQQLPLTGTITKDLCQQHLSPCQSYTLTDLLNRAHNGDRAMTYKIVQHLLNDAQEHLLIWAIIRDLNILSYLHKHNPDSNTIAKLTTIWGIWPSHLDLVNKSLQRLSYQAVRKLAALAQHAQAISKGYLPGNAPALLTSLYLGLSGATITTYPLEYLYD